MSLQARHGVEYANRPESSDCDQTFSLPFDVDVALVQLSVRIVDCVPCTYSCVVDMLGHIDKVCFARVSPPLTSFSECTA